MITEGPGLTVVFLFAELLLQLLHWHWSDWEVAPIDGSVWDLVTELGKIQARLCDQLLDTCKSKFLRVLLIPSTSFLR